MDLAFLPAVNASLNALATLLLLAGRILIAGGRVDAHRRVMSGAFGVSTLFLICYVAHKLSRSFENTTFNVEGLAKTAYLAMLASHVVLAALVPFLAVTLIVLATRGRLAAHRGLARVAWPIWMYVSLTGVLIYALLYHFNPPAG